MAPASSVTALTAKESDMLVAVVSQMGDVPDVNWDIVAAAVGQKYARNARASCKKLFEKIRGNGTTFAHADGDGSDGEETGGKITSPKKTPAKKGVGARSTPVKASSATTKKGITRKVEKKSAAQVKEEEMEFAEAEIEVYEDENIDGKFECPYTPILCEDEPIPLESQGDFSVGYLPSDDVTEDELFYAKRNEITVEEYRFWVAQNNYYYRAPTPEVFSL